MIHRYEPMSEFDREAISRGNCPSCGRRGFVIGPAGGASINIECANLNCRERYNVTFMSGAALMGHRIEMRSDGAPAWPSDPLH